MMSKKKKKSQFPKSNSSPSKPVAPSPELLKPAVSSSPQEVSQDTDPEIVSRVNSQRIQPNKMSLDAHEHIQNYLKANQKSLLNKEDLNAILRLSQHLRVFGLLSAVGYINQSNDQEGKVRKRTVPIWKSLLGQLLETEPSITNQELMEKVIVMNREEPSQYMANWRKSLILTNHWNFWARAYSERNP